MTPSWSPTGRAVPYAQMRKLRLREGGGSAPRPTVASRRIQTQGSHSGHETQSPGLLSLHDESPETLQGGKSRLGVWLLLAWCLCIEETSGGNLETPPASGSPRHPKASSTSGQLAGATANIWGREGGRGGRRLMLPGSQGQSPGPAPDSQVSTLVSGLRMCVRIRVCVHMCERMCTCACIHVTIVATVAFVRAQALCLCVCVDVAMCVLCLNAVCLCMCV